MITHTYPKFQINLVRKRCPNIIFLLPITYIFKLHTWSAFSGTFKYFTFSMKTNGIISFHGRLNLRLLYESKDWDLSNRVTSRWLYQSLIRYVKIVPTSLILVGGGYPDVAWLYPRWRYQIEPFTALLALCAGNSPVTGEFHSQRPVTRSLMFSLICALTNSWVNNRDAGDLRRHRAHYDVTVVTS